MANFPTVVDSFSTPTAGSLANSPSVSGTMNSATTAIVALETKVGVDSSAVATSLDYKLTNTSSSNPGHKHTLANGATDVTSSAAELNILDGATLTTTELNYVDGVTSAIQTQLGTKAPTASPTFTGTVILPKTLEIQDTSADHQYVLAVSELTADRTVTLPLLTSSDEFMFKAHAQTVTNKRNEPRIVTAASYTTDTGTSLSVATADQFQVTAQAGALKFNNPGGTAVAGQKLIIRIKDDGTARALTYDTEFRAMGNPLPSTTVLSKTLYMGFIYNATDTKWDLVALAQEV